MRASPRANASVLHSSNCAPVSRSAAPTDQGGGLARRCLRRVPPWRAWVLVRKVHHITRPAPHKLGARHLFAWA